MNILRKIYENTVGITPLRDRINSLEAACKHADEHFKSICLQRDIRTADLKDARAKVAELEAKAVKNIVEIIEKNEKLIAKNEQLMSKNTEISRLSDHIARQDVVIDTLQSRVKTQDIEIDNWGDKNRDLEERLKASERYRMLDLEKDTEDIVKLEDKVIELEKERIALSTLSHEQADKIEAQKDKVRDLQAEIDHLSTNRGGRYDALDISRMTSMHGLGISYRLIGLTYGFTKTRAIQLIQKGKKNDKQS